jgi:tetratricopeptide (TPR) repeat protein
LTSWYIDETIDSIRIGVLIYFIISISIPYILARAHKKGMQLIKQQKFNEAISWFEKSIISFTKNPWRDKYRYILLLSSSKMTYKEMDLCNIAFCYSQTNNGKMAKELYEKVLKEFPENGIAISGLKLINSVEQYAIDTPSNS